MEDGLRDVVSNVAKECGYYSLNPCFNGRWSASFLKTVATLQNDNGLNPCFNGRWSASVLGAICIKQAVSLNPCFNGRWSASYGKKKRLYYLSGS